MYTKKAFIMPDVIKVELRKEDTIIKEYPHYSDLLSEYDCNLIAPQMLQVTGVEDIDTMRFNIFYPVDKDLSKEKFKNEKITFLPLIEYKHTFYTRFVELGQDTIEDEVKNLIKYAYQLGYTIKEAPIQIKHELYGDSIIDMYLPLEEVEGF